MRNVSEVLKVVLADYYNYTVSICSQGHYIQAPFAVPQLITKLRHYHNLRKLIGELEEIGELDTLKLVLSAISVYSHTNREPSPIARRPASALNLQMFLGLLSNIGKLTCEALREECVEDMCPPSHFSLFKSS